ncbi:MAG: hypothetical protein JXD19_11365 [Deltaproteobacteria bacterium]|nr:hypothetical protein [Deltaproteobacteria bacterium]
MQFYTRQHKFYCGIDLYARKMDVCILDEKGEIREHRNVRTDANIFLQMITPYREDIVVGVACMFTWYWLADHVFRLQGNPLLSAGPALPL